MKPGQERHEGESSMSRHEPDEATRAIDESLREGEGSGA